MENEILEQKSFTNQLQDKIKKKKRTLLVFFSIFVLALGGFGLLNFYKEKENKKISEQYVQAGIYLVNENKEDAKLIYKDIIKSENKFYSVLALKNILENELEKDENEILELFAIVQSINIDKEQLNLIKLKKALYLFKISKKNEGNKLLEEIISDNSIWKDTAIELSK
ncbi:MAG: hypothetical protein CBD57_00435 [Candidatus Pelagibacter sp. TMED197]|nr:hypothetical protein [Candidatus Pelagibacter sp.]OUW59514.1 MAG: hypothetical protein CBD57_00435 [Candidatus Pelagibacter sp. TMED197]